MAMDGLITEGIRKERAILDDLKAQASVIIDTTTLTPRQLREKINESFKSKGRPRISDRNLYHLVLNTGCRSGFGYCDG